MTRGFKKKSPEKEPTKKEETSEVVEAPVAKEEVKETPKELASVAKVEPEVKATPAAPTPVPKPEIPVALPSAVAKDFISAKALQTTVKHCGGGWVHLTKGKMVIAKSATIKYLRTHGLVE